MRLVSVVLAVAVASSGCAGSENDPKIQQADLPRIVLQPEDLEGPWLQFDEGPQATADAPPGGRAAPTRFGRVAGWKSRYRRSGTAATEGPLVVESRADLFAEEEGAKDDLRALEDDLEEGLALGSAERVDAQAVGDESVVATLREGEGNAAVRYFLIAWRADAVIASVLVNGFDAGTTLSDALDLARQQHRRIEAAIG